MGVESGPSGGIGTAVSIGSAISPGPAISAGIELSLTARFGPSITAESFMPSSPNVAEGPLSVSLAGFKPLRAKEISAPSLGGIFKRELNAVEAVSEAELILSEARVKPLTEQGPVAEAEHWLGISRFVPVLPDQDGREQNYRKIEPVFVPVPVIEPAVRPSVDIFPKTELKTKNIVFVQPVNQPRAENKVATQLPKVLTNSMLQEQELEVTEQQVEEIVEETQKVTESEQLVAVYTKDETAATNRLTRALEEFIKLYKEIKGKVKGTKLLERLSDELDEEKSRLLFQLGIKNKPDGSNVDGFRKRLSVMEFEGLEDGIKKITQANEEFDPVKLGKDGKLEPPEAVVKVLQNTAEPIRPVKRLINKIITRRLQQLTQQSPRALNVTEVVDVKTEPSIEENPQLAEVFGFGFTALTD